MLTLVLVLARRGSKGLPGKNTMHIAGRPCIDWTIDDALRSRHAQKVMVSSDDEKALSIAHIRGVGIHRRSPELASDTATIDQAARAALVGIDADPVVILYGNVPVRPDGLIDRAIDMLLDSGCDSVQSYEPVGKHHPWWMARVDRDTGDVCPWEGDVLNHGVYRRQDLPPAFVPTGGVIVVRRDALELRLGVEPGAHAFLGLERRGVVDPAGETVDIDTRVDAIVAEAVLSERLRAAA